MSATVLYMSMSLDGFIAGPNEGPDNGLGDGGERLHDWALSGGGADDREDIRRSGGVNGRVLDEFMATGRRRPRDVRAGGRLGRRHHDGVPIFIYSRRKPGIDIGEWPLVTYVTDVETALTQAREAAGSKNVLVHGAAVA
jgi:dihydrofolate reductase